MQTRTLW